MEVTLRPTQQTLSPQTLSQQTLSQETLLQSTCLPPLPAGPRGRRRFSLAEEHAFGRWSVVDVCGRRRTIAPANGTAPLPGAKLKGRGYRSASVPNLHTVSAPADLLQADSGGTSSVGSRASTPYCEVNGGEVDQVQAVLDRLLPADAQARALSSSLLRPPCRRRRNTVRCGTLSSTHSLPGQGAAASAARFPREALEQFRSRLLCRYRSLHEAFAPSLANASTEKVAMGPRELRTSLARIGPGETDALFAASGMAWQGCTHSGMTILQFFHELVGVSAEALLWELRCRLVACQLWPWPSDLQALRNFLGSDSLGSESEKVLVLDASCELALGEDAASVPLSGFGHDVWLHFCTQLGLTSVEAEWLYNMFKDEAGSVDISRLTDVVRATVSSDAALMQLARKLLKSYGSVRDAFAAVTCKSSERVMRWREFQRLAFSLDISSQGAQKLWSALRHGEALSGASGGEEESSYCDDQAMEAPVDSEDGLSENEFVQRMVSWTPDLLSWSPDTVLQELERELLKKFAGWSECRRALRQYGLPGSFELSPKRLKAGLLSVGIARCDADVLLNKARVVLGKTFDSPVTFEDIIQTIRDTSGDWSPGKSLCSHSSPGFASSQLKESQQLSDDASSRSNMSSSSRCPSLPSTRSASLPSTRCPSDVCDDSEWAAKDSSNRKARRNSKSSSRATSDASATSTSIPSAESNSPEAAARVRQERLGVSHRRSSPGRKSWGGGETAGRESVKPSHKTCWGSHKAM
mmetsp:Transcript_42943/g.79811  ORF Transcript_42943/g.79811 Transcript_42943/m.79811 type:complete len:753 (-) Transcript_42943:96-2354(-)